jgi:hypothetical protein
MARAFLFKRQLLDRTVRTVANVLSIGFVTGMRCAGSTTVAKPAS